MRSPVSMSEALPWIGQLPALSSVQDATLISAFVSSKRWTSKLRAPVRGTASSPLQATRKLPPSAATPNDPAALTLEAKVPSGAYATSSRGTASRKSTNPECNGKGPSAETSLDACATEAPVELKTVRVASDSPST